MQDGRPVHTAHGETGYCCLYYLPYLDGMPLALQSIDLDQFVVSHDEVIVTAIVRGLVDRLGRKDHRNRSDETFAEMGLDDLDMTDLECEIECCLHKTFVTGLKLSDTIRSVVWRLQAGQKP